MVCAVSTIAGGLRLIRSISLRSPPLRFSCKLLLNCQFGFRYRFRPCDYAPPCRKLAAATGPSILPFWPGPSYASQSNTNQACVPHDISAAVDISLSDTASDILKGSHRTCFQLPPPVPCLCDCLQHMWIHNDGVWRHGGRWHNFRLSVALTDGERNEPGQGGRQSLIGRAKSYTPRKLGSHLTKMGGATPVGSGLLGLSRGVGG